MTDSRGERRSAGSSTATGATGGLGFVVWVLGELGSFRVEEVIVKVAHLMSN